MNKRIAILSHFDSFQPGYALHVGWLERANLLKYFGQDFDFLVNTNCPADIYPNQKNVLEKIRPGAEFSKRAAFFGEMYAELLQPYDFVMTADMVYQKKGNFLANNAGQRIAAPVLNCHWLHWLHSSWTNPPTPIDTRKPEHLRFKMPEKSTLIYLNSHELPGVMHQYSCTAHEVWAVYNPKDIRSFYEFDDLSWELTDFTKPWEKDAIMLFPFCATRLESKGFDTVTNVFAALKRAGKKVMLINAVANSRSQQDKLRYQDKYMAEKGLLRNEDYIWSCDFTDNFKPLPRKTIADLFKITNVFVWASWRETVGNAFQEAKVSGNLMVLSKYLPSNIEMGGEDAIWIHASHCVPGRGDGVFANTRIIRYRDPDTGEDTTNDYFDGVAEEIIAKLPSRKHQWQFSYEHIWYEQLYPLIYLRQYDREGNYTRKVLPAPEDHI